MFDDLTGMMTSLTQCTIDLWQSVNYDFDWLPHGEAVFRIDVGAVYPRVDVRSLTEYWNTPGSLDEISISTAVIPK
jgi:hypothetical protein